MTEMLTETERRILALAHGMLRSRNIPKLGTYGNGLRSGGRLVAVRPSCPLPRHETGTAPRAARACATAHRWSIMRTVGPRWNNFEDAPGICRFSGYRHRGDRTSRVRSAVRSGRTVRFSCKIRRPGAGAGRGARDHRMAHPCVSARGGGREPGLGRALPDDGGERARRASPGRARRQRGEQCGALSARQRRRATN